MHNLSELIEKWQNSALNFREAESLINLLITDNNRLEKENKKLTGWHDVVQQCELMMGCRDTSESPRMSNLPNLVRDAMIQRHA